MATLPKLPTFVICVNNRGADDLRPLEVYRRIPDARSARAGLMRVVDESGEDYLYPKDYFIRFSTSRAERMRIEKLFMVNGRRVVRISKSRAKKQAADA